MMYLAQVINSTIREITPILLVALCAGVCSKVQVFNIALTLFAVWFLLSGVVFDIPVLDLFK